MVITSIIDRLTGTGYEVYDTYLEDEVEPQYPYLLVWETTPTHAINKLAASGNGAEESTLIGVMAVALSVEGVRIAANKAKRLLTSWTPGLIDGVYWDEPEHKPAYGRGIVRDKDTPLTDGNAAGWGSDFYELTGTTSRNRN